MAAILPDPPTEGLARWIKATGRPHKLPNKKGTDMPPPNWCPSQALAGCICPCVCTLKVTPAGSPGVCCPGRAAWGMEGDQGLTPGGIRSLPRKKSPTWPFSTTFTCQQEHESPTKHEGGQDQPCSPMKVILPWHHSSDSPDCSHRRQYGLTLRLFLEETQQYGGLNPFATGFVFQCNAESKEARFPGGVWKSKVSKVTTDHIIFIIFPWPFLTDCTPTGPGGPGGNISVSVSLSVTQKSRCSHMLGNLRNKFTTTCTNPLQATSCEFVRWTISLFSTLWTYPILFIICFYNYS